MCLQIRCKRVEAGWYGWQSCLVGVWNSHQDIVPPVQISSWEAPILSLLSRAPLSAFLGVKMTTGPERLTYLILISHTGNWVYSEKRCMGGLSPWQRLFETVCIDT